MLNFVALGNSHYRYLFDDGEQVFKVIIARDVLMELKFGRGILQKEKKIVYHPLSKYAVSDVKGIYNRFVASGVFTQKPLKPALMERVHGLRARFHYHSMYAQHSRKLLNFSCSANKVT